MNTQSLLQLYVANLDPVSDTCLPLIRTAFTAKQFTLFKPIYFECGFLVLSQSE